MVAFEGVSVNHWKLTLSYDGSHFHGWQVQPGLRTVQGVLADALKCVTGEAVLPQGSGRTDAGVHAVAQVATFSLSVAISSENLLRALNRVLPAAIRGVALEPAAPGFHARHSAERKTYEYRIFERRSLEPLPDSSSAPFPTERICSPFLAPYVWDCRWPLSWERLQAGASLLCGTHDFTSFAASDPDRSLRQPAPQPFQTDGAGNTGVNPVKTIWCSEWSRESGLLLYRITGSGFLHHMVRTIVGTLVDLGRGSFEVEDIARLLATRDRSAAGPTAPARGLYLLAVEYPPGCTAAGHPATAPRAAATAEPAPEPEA